MPIPWDQVGIGSGWALVAAFVWLIYTGRLVPKSEHVRALEHAEHEASEWRTEGRIKDQQISEKDSQLGHMAEVGRTVNAIMRSIQRNARSGDQTSHEDSL